MTATALTADKVDSRETRKQRAFFAKVRRGEAAYAVNLRKIAKHVSDLVDAFDPSDPHQIQQLEDELGVQLDRGQGDVHFGRPAGAGFAFAAALAAVSAISCAPFEGSGSMGSTSRTPLDTSVSMGRS